MWSCRSRLGVKLPADDLAHQSFGQADEAVIQIFHGGSRDGHSVFRLRLRPGKIKPRNRRSNLPFFIANPNGVSYAFNSSLAWHLGLMHRIILTFGGCFL